MSLVERAKNIVVTPRTEWEAIAADPTPTGKLITGYVLPLAGVAAIAGFIGATMVSFMGVRIGFAWGLGMAIYQVVMSIVSVFLVGFIIDALAPTFGGQKNMAQAVKVAAYSYTPVWLLGILAIVPMLGMLAILGAVYAVYLLFLGLPRLMRNPPDKSAGYTALVVVSAIVVGVVVGMIGSAFMGASMMGAGAMGGPGGAVTYDKGSSAAKLDEFARKMEEAAKKMEAAEKSGDPAKQMEAAMGALGTALSGGKGVEPVQLDALKPFVPEKLAGLPRTSMRADRSGVAGLMAAKVEADYAEGDKQFQLEVTDTGGAAGLMGLAAWAAVGATGSESEDDNHRERMRREGNRLVREEVSKRGGPNSYSVILADRYVVSAEGNVDIGTLKSAVGSIDLAKLEALK